MKILFYDDKYYMFSNFSAHQVEYKGILYPTAEHAYQSQKFEDEKIREAIRNANNPLSAKTLANETYREKRRTDWDEVKVSVMYEIVKEKVKQREEVKNNLINTGSAEIIEKSPVDYF